MTRRQLAVVMTGLALVMFAVILAQKNECVRGRASRIDNADGWTAHRNYISAVLDASSVKGDVKSAASEALIVYDRISKSLTARARVDCGLTGLF